MAYYSELKYLPTHSEGVWNTEPDFILWEDEDTGYLCCINRNIYLFLNGYVGVPNTHPETNKKVEEFEDGILSKIITWSDSTLPCTLPMELLKNQGKVLPDIDNHWFIGFDCSQDRDYIPGEMGGFAEAINHLFYTPSTYQEEYKNVVYVTQEIEKLVKYLKEAEDACLP